MATVFERVKKIVLEHLDVEDKDVISTARLVEDLGADSLDLVELTMSLEEEFSDAGNKIEIPDEDAEKIITIQNAIDYIISKGVKDK